MRTSQVQSIRQANGTYVRSRRDDDHRPSSLPGPVEYLSTFVLFVVRRGLLEFKYRSFPRVCESPSSPPFFLHWYSPASIIYRHCVRVPFAKKRSGSLLVKEKSRKHRVPE